jgi:hypothetical protein
MLLDQVKSIAILREQKNRNDRFRRRTVKGSKNPSTPSNLSSGLLEDEQSRHNDPNHSHFYYIQRRQLLTIRASMILQAMELFQDHSKTIGTIETSTENQTVPFPIPKPNWHTYTIMLAKTPSALPSSSFGMNNRQMHLNSDFELYEIYNHYIKKRISMMEYATNVVQRMVLRYEQDGEAHMKPNSLYQNSILICHHEYLKYYHHINHHHQNNLNNLSIIHHLFK